jgi:hypothetical protein
MKEVRSEDFPGALMFLIMQEAVMVARWVLVVLAVC